MNDFGKILVVIGISIAIIGVLIWAGFGKDWFGRLPGDIQYSKGDFSFHFPFVTCLILSAILTLVMWLLKK